MTRKTFQDWSVGDLALGLYPERDDRSASKLDRWIGNWVGLMLLWTSPLRRFALKRFVADVDAAAALLADVSDAVLRQRIVDLRPRFSRQGLTRANVAECFALVQEVSYRTLGKRHYPVQIIGGYALLRGGLAEMATGEGKTLTAALPAVAVALAGLPVHVVTVNEYLAGRDAQTLGPLYRFFGLSVGWIEPDQDSEARKRAYACDITYCVNKDLVFDYLRDGLSAPRNDSASRRALRRFLHGHRSRGELLRGLYFAIVDEADSIFVDEARTPLIISSERGDPGAQARYEQALHIARQLTPDAYQMLERERSVRLTASGQHALELATGGMDGQWRFRKAREELIEQALAAQYLYARDKHYIVADNKIQIVDEFTGRTMADRSWERGLHQLIETKEGLETTGRRETIARITYQRFFRRYLQLAGMTGTGAEVAAELRSVFGLASIRIPTNRPLDRRCLGERVFLTDAGRSRAVLERIVELKTAGRAVLVGTRSVEASERLSRGLRRTAVLSAQQAYLGVTSGLAQVTALEEALNSARTALDANKRGLEVGTRIGIDVLNAQQQLAVTERNLAKARYDTLMSLLRLKGAAGSLGEPDITEVNALLAK